MTIPEKSPSALWSPDAEPGDQDHQPLDHALDDLKKKDQWVNDFIERLNSAVQDIGRTK